MKLMKGKLSALILACAMILGGAIACQAAPGDDYDGPGYGAQLTPEQMDAARKIFADSYTDMAGTRQALTAKRAELDYELASPQPDRGRIEALSREIGELRGKMLSARADVRARLAQKGLPAEFYGYGGPRGNWDREPEVWRGPAWHHGHGGHRGGRGWGCGGCW